MKLFNKKLFNSFRLFNYNKVCKTNFTLSSKLKDFLKGKREDINYKNNSLIKSLDVFKSKQFETKVNEKDKDVNIEYSQSSSFVNDKFINYRERKELSISPLNKDQINIIESVKSKIEKSNVENQIKTYNKVDVLNVWEKLDYYEATAEGKITNPYLEKICKKFNKTNIINTQNSFNNSNENSEGYGNNISSFGKNKTINNYNNNYKNNENTLNEYIPPSLFDNQEQYLNYKEKIKSKLKRDIRNKLTPMEYFITQGKNTERAFTGYYADFYEVGLYSCKVCTQKLFSSTHKYKTDSGWASFWNYLPLSINFKEDAINKYKTPTQAILPIQFVGSKPVKRMTCTHVIIYNIIVN